MQCGVGGKFPLFPTCLSAFGETIYGTGPEDYPFHISFRSIPLHYGKYGKSGWFVLNSSLKEFGDIYISALTILQSSMQFASVPLTGFAQGFVPIISYNFGHGDKQRVKDCFRIVLVTMFSFNLILMLS